VSPIRVHSRAIVASATGGRVALGAVTGRSLSEPAEPPGARRDRRLVPRAGKRYKRRLMSSALAPAGDLPVLWQLQISHYNEKVRWALDLKRIPHVRRSLLPGAHAIKARRLTGADTTPVLTLHGRSIGDSTAIIAELEEHWPQPPLYPADPEQRARALELEEFFDEELGPHIRRAVYHVLLDHPELVVPLFVNGQPPVARVLIRTAFPLLKVAMRQALAINPEAAAESETKTIAAMDRLEAELTPSGYLVGDSFSVADLTAAALFYPVVRPAAFPYPSVADVPERARDLLDSLAARPGGRWVAAMYERHRQPDQSGMASSSGVPNVSV
jgi:glutathione S-transferase